jgi:hypothetical protein
MRTNMTEVRTRDERGAQLSSEQREALWKWRWLGLRSSTPAFKASLVLLAAVAFALAVYPQVPMP